jgi:DNA-binding transcriptional regulator YdaS (Cro superfamily)
MAKPKKKPAHRPPHEPTDKDRRIVKAMTAGGLDQTAVAGVLGISKPTLRKHYKQLLATAANEAHAQISASLFSMGTVGKNVAAAIWWEKTRRGMSETQRVEQTGPDGRPIESVVTYRWAEPAKK